MLAEEVLSDGGEVVFGQSLDGDGKEVAEALILGGVAIGRKGLDFREIGLGDADGLGQGDLGEAEIGAQDLGDVHCDTYLRVLR